MSRLRRWARALEQQSLVVYFAARDPRTPWPTRLLALGVAAYAANPIDLIPDFIPVSGYLDDLCIGRLGVALVLRLVPDDVVRSAREKAAARADRPTSRAMAVGIVAIWLLAAAAIGAFFWRRTF